MRRSRLVLTATLAVPAAVLTALSPATALGPGGWDHVGSGATSGSASLNGRVSVLTTGSEKLLVGGTFTDAGGRPNADRVGAWDGQTWSALGSLPLDNGEIRAIAYDDGKTYVGGTFVNAGGNAGADFLAVWDGVSWAPFCNSVTPPTFDGNVDALQIIGGTLFVGGEFQNAADIDTADYLLACDLSTGESTSLFATDGQFTGPIYALAADSDGTLYAGGGFIKLAQIPGADNVAAYAGGSWHALGGSGTTAAVTGFVRSLDTNGTDLYVGTDALAVAGIAQADHVARWDGTAWSALGSDTAGTNGWLPTSASIYALEAHAAGVVAGGTFLDANGQPAADYLAAFNGTTWRPIGSNGAGDGPVPAEIHALQIYQKHLYAGGNFTTAGGDARAKFLARYPLVLADNAISRSLASGYVGGDIYDNDGRDGTRTVRVRKGHSATFYVRVQNDGLTTEDFRVSGHGQSRGSRRTTSCRAPAPTSRSPYAPATTSPAASGRTTRSCCGCASTWPRTPLPGPPSGSPPARAGVARSTPCAPWSRPASEAYAADVHRIFTTSFASVYPHYVTKVEKKGRTKAELDQAISWLTGFDEAALADHLAEETTFEDFFADAELNPNAELITGVVCGIRVEDIDDPLMQQIRYLDKLVDELAKGKPMEKVLRA